VKLLRAAPDETVQQDYLDLNSRKRVTLHLYAEGLSDVALLQLNGTDFQPLSLPDLTSIFTPDSSPVLCSYPFGISQPQATPRLLSVPASLQGSLVKMEHNLDPGESGAPLLNADGKVVGLATSGNQAIPIQVAQKLIP
jgi:hypothetical protein